MSESTESSKVLKKINSSAGKDKGPRKVATFAMGCFWGPQKTFDHVPGVTNTVVGYTGGSRANPTYESCCANDGHTEAIRIEYDPEKVSYEGLLEVFWKTHHPSGGKAQYKSAIWYHDEEQRAIAEAVCKGKGNRGAVVHVDKDQPWYDAEGYHQKYYKGGGGGGGCTTQ